MISVAELVRLAVTRGFLFSDIRGRGRFARVTGRIACGQGRCSNLLTVLKREEMNQGAESVVSVV